MSNKDINDRDLENVSGGAVDLQQQSGIDPKGETTGPSTGSGGSGGQGDPGINDMQQNNDGPASGA